MKFLKKNASLKSPKKLFSFISRMKKITMLLMMTIAFPLLGMEKENTQSQKQPQQNNKIDLLLGYLKGIDPSVVQRTTEDNYALFSNQPPPDPFTNQPPPDPFTNQPPLGG